MLTATLAQICAFLCSMILTAAPALAQMPPVGRIELFGHPESAERARAVVADLEGAKVSAEVRARERIIAELPGVTEAKIEAVCCDGGVTTLYIGVRGEGDPAPRFNSAPTGAARLPGALVALGERFERALADAVRRGVVGDDLSAGHSMLADSAARAVQEEFIGVASVHAQRLREVLATSADPGHRALAGQILAYAPDKRAIAPDLLAAVRDPEPGVRNVAMRALWIIAGYASAHPDLRVEIAPGPFVDLANSIVWTDRNKASLVLMELSATRDGTLLETLRTRAFESLLTMARWENPGHSFPGLAMLGRMAGLSEEAIFAAVSEGRKQTIIDAALRIAPRSRR
jgi:hypothetical protein